MAGASLVRFDSNFKFSPVNGSPPIYLDTEGQLDLSEYETVPTVTWLLRFNHRHALAASYTAFSRSSTFSVSENDLDLGDLVIDVNATLNVWLRSQDVDVSYVTSLRSDDRSTVLLKMGLYVLLLDAGVRAEGSYSVGGVPELGEWERSMGLNVPLPLLGIMFDFDLTSRWALTAGVDAVFWPFGDIQGEALRTRLHSRYAFSKHVGAALGISYFEVGVRNIGELGTFDVSYAYDGLTLGVYLRH